MSISTFFADLFGSGSNDDTTIATRNISITADSDFSYDVQGEIMRGAIEIGIDIIAAAIGKVEIQTYKNNKYYRGSDYYRWNVKPNHNQSATEFWHEVVYKLIKERQVLIVPVANQLIAADSFTINKRDLAPSFFTAVTKGSYSISGSFNTDNCIFISAEYHTNLNKLISGLGTVLDESLKIALKHYNDEGGEHGILYLNSNPALSDDEQDAYAEELNKRFKKFYSQRDSLAILYEGMRYEKVSSNNSVKTAFISDVQAITKEAYSKVAQALKISPALLLGEGIKSEEINSFINFCIAPFLDTIVECANAVMYSKDEYLSGNYIKVDYSNVKYYDAIECADRIDKLRSDGIYTPNEIRVKFGDSTIDEDFADDYVITKNYAETEKAGD